MVLTAAHNLLQVGKHSISCAVAVEAFIGYHLCSSSEGTGVHKRFGKIAMVPKEWTVRGCDPVKDMALMGLDRGFRHVTPALYKAPSSGKSRVLVVGYPGDNRNQVRGSCSDPEFAGCMYVVKGDAELSVVKLLQYTLSTMPGKCQGLRVP